MVRNVILKIIVIMIIFQTTFVPISKASFLDDIFEKGDEFVEEGKNNQYVTNIDKDGNEVIEKDENGNPIEILNQKQLQKNINQIYNVIFGIGVALSVIIGSILGIKFMIGSIEEQAKIKETLVPYALGCIVVFGAFGIWKIIITLGGNIFT